jgi:ubiquinol oxidase
VSFRARRLHHKGLTPIRTWPQRRYTCATQLLYAVRPSSSYRLNADFEDHAEHEYALFVAEHPELEHKAYHGLFADAYGHFDSLADLFRQIGHDERVHKDGSLARMREPRFR